MKRMILAALALACAPLSGCAGLAGLLATPGIPTSPAAVANRTTIDETAMRLAETAYATERTALDLAADAGVLTGASASKAADFDNAAYKALGIARRAYSAANATDFASAVGDMRDAIISATALVKK